MKQVRIVIATDHRGYHMKEFIKKNLKLRNQQIVWLDVGAYDATRSDYPLFGMKAVDLIKQERAQFGILLCGTGIGMAITANRFSEIYAGLVWNSKMARLAKEHDNVNVLVLPSDFISNGSAVQLTRIWLKSSFKKGRYARRISLIDRID